MELEELYKRIQPRIYAFYYARTLNREVAEDLTQEVFYEAIKGFNTFKAESTIQTWLFGIAKNLLKKHYRSKKYRSSVSASMLEEEKKELTPEELFIKKEEQDRLLAKINRLDDLPKEVVILRIYGELSFREIGLLLEKSENFARVTFHRAKLKLHKELEGYDG